MIFKRYRSLCVLFVLLITLVSCTQNKCSSIDVIPASIEARIEPGRQGVIGLAGDKDSLNFGATSPTMIARKSINVEYSGDADVVIKMEGDFASWVTISDSEFFLAAGERKEVAFDVKIPGYTAPGNYTGQAVFCFKEK